MYSCHHHIWVACRVTIPIMCPSHFHSPVGPSSYSRGVIGLVRKLETFHFHLWALRIGQWKWWSQYSNRLLFILTDMHHYMKSSKLQCDFTAISEITVFSWAGWDLLWPLGCRSWQPAGNQVAAYDVGPQLTGSVPAAAGWTEGGWDVAELSHSAAETRAGA